MNIEIANRLYKLRKKYGFSQEELAEKIGVSRQAVSKWERSESSPDTENLIALSKIYGVTIDDMLNDEINDYSEVENETENLDDSAETSYTTDYEHTDTDGKYTSRENILKGFPIAIFATIIFFVLGFVFDLWHPAWIVFMIIPAFNYFAGKKKRKDGSEKRYPWLSFPYPILVTAIFLLIGFVWDGWAYAWIVFLTIPIWGFFASK